MGILALGAGAGAGFEKLLADLLAEKALKDRTAQGQAQLQETSTYNRAEEGYQNRSLDELSKNRQAVLGATNEERLRQDADRNQRQTESVLKMRPIGAMVDPSEKANEIKLGAATQGNYDWKPPTMGASMAGDKNTPPGEMGPTPERISWRGTPEQIAAQERIDKPSGGAVNLQRKTVTYGGKAVDIWQNPRTMEEFLADGTNVTGQTQHRDTPVAPDLTVVQTDEGILPRPDVIAAAKAGTPKKPPLTSATRTIAEGSQMLAPHIDKLKAEAQQLDKAGLFGPAMSRIRKAAESVGTLDEFFAKLESDPGNDPLIGKFSTDLGLMATGAGRVHGGARGGGSPQMLQHFKALLADSSSLEMFLGRLDSLDDYMEGYAAGPKGAGTAPAGGGGGSNPNDPLGLGLK